MEFCNSFVTLTYSDDRSWRAAAGRESNRGFAAWIAFSKSTAGSGAGDESPTYRWWQESWRKILRSHSFVRDGERMDGAQMCGGWFAKSKCRSFDSSAHTDTLRMTGAHMGYRYPTSQNRDVGHPIVAASWRCFPCPQRRGASAPDMGRPKVGERFCDPTHSFATANEWMGHRCVVAGLRKMNADSSAALVAYSARSASTALTRAARAAGTADAMTAARRMTNADRLSASAPGWPMAAM